MIGHIARHTVSVTVVLLALLLTGCDPAKEAVPDPERPPTPKVGSYSDASQRAARVSFPIAGSAFM